MQFRRIATSSKSSSPNAERKQRVSESVLDSSVLIAILNSEHLDDDVLDVIEDAIISAVNYAEVWTKVHDLGLPHAPRTREAFSLLDRVEPFTESQAKLAASLRPATRLAGLSLGHRACLALALELGAEVYTADRQWSNIRVGCAIHLIR
jgi:PIN domain nuclease of toxin-antitoxin system